MNCVLLSSIDAGGVPNRFIQEALKLACAKYGVELSMQEQLRFDLPVEENPVCSADLLVACMTSKSAQYGALMAAGYRAAFRRQTILLLATDEADSELRTLVEELVGQGGCDLVRTLDFDGAFEAGGRNRIKFIDDIEKALGEAKKSLDERRDSLGEVYGGTPRFRPHPFAEFRFEKITQACPCVAHSSDAPLFFGREGSIVDVDVSELIEDLKRFVWRPQFQCFLEEQGKLIGELTGLRLGNNSETMLWANYPIVFDRHPNAAYNGRAFLPIIVSNSEDARYIHLSVLYLEISPVTEEMGSDASKIFKSKLVLPADPLSGFLRLDEHERYDVFLAHNSADKPLARELCRALRLSEISVWFDEDNIQPGPLAAMLSGAMSRSDKILVAIGKEGVGKWQSAFEIQNAINLAVRHGTAVIPVLLPGLSDFPDEFNYLEAYAGVRLKSLVPGQDDPQLSQLVRLSVRLIKRKPR